MSSFKLSFSRAIALLGLLGLGLAQVGCAHSVMEPSVSVHSRIGHFPVHTRMGVHGPVVYAPPPRVIYAPPPPPRVVYVPGVVGQSHGWGHGHERRWGHERKQRHHHGDGHSHGHGHERGHGRGG